MSDPNTNTGNGQGQEPVKVGTEPEPKVEWTKEKFDGLLKDEGFRKVFESNRDQFVTSALKTNSAKLTKEFEDRLPKIREEIMRELNPGESPADKIAREALRQVEEERKLRITSELRESATSYATSRDMPHVGQVITDMIKEAFDVTKVERNKVLEFIDKLGEAFTQAVNDKVKKLKGQNSTAPGGGDVDVFPTTMEGWNTFWNTHPGQENYIKYHDKYDSWANSQRHR